MKHILAWLNLDFRAFRLSMQICIVKHNLTFHSKIADVFALPSRETSAPKTPQWPVIIAAASNVLVTPKCRRHQFGPWMNLPTDVGFRHPEVFTGELLTSRRQFFRNRAYG